LAAQNKNSIKGDYQALQDLYHSTNGPNWYNNNGWKDMTHETMDEAVGITTNSKGRVTKIDLQRGFKSIYGEKLKGNDLSGTLPESLGNLTKVTEFNVKQNDMSGPIPESIGNMESLKILRLGGQLCHPSTERGAWNLSNYPNTSHPECPFSGTPNGKERLMTNHFSGDIPATIGNLINLEMLEARSQNFTGTLPETMGNMISLKYLYIDNMQG